MSEESAKKFDLKPSQKLCQKCEKICQGNLKSSQEESSAEEYENPAWSSTEAYKDLVLEMDTMLLGISPFKPVSDRDKPTYGKRKVKDIERAAKINVAKILDLPTEEPSSTEGEVVKAVRI